MSLPLMRQPPTDRRKMISAEALQSMITAAVKACDPDCEQFVGIYVERTALKSGLDANWDIRGIKFGRADRDKCAKALEIIVAHFQEALGLSTEPTSVAASPFWTFIRRASLSAPIPQ
jgi:hypothetical protein